MSIRGNGNIGVGTTNPAAKLEIADGANDATKYGSLQITRSGTNNGNNRLYLSMVREGHLVGGLGFVPNSSVWGAFAENTDSPILTFDGTAVGIGTTSPDRPLHVFGSEASGTPGRGVSMSGGTGSSSNASIEMVGGDQPYLDFTNETDVGSDYSARWWLTSSDVLQLAGARLTIGTATPAAALHIVSGTNFSIEANGYLDVNGDTGHSGSADRNVSIRGSGFIVGQEFAAVSDARIKQLEGTSDAAEDLGTIMDLDVVDYTYVDKVTMGAGPQKKLVAQQVRGVYPQAVSEGSDYIPNVYEMSTAATYDENSGLLRVTTAKAHEFAAGDWIRIVETDQLEEVTVQQVIDAHTFAIERAAADRIFVYGKRVDDFLSVSYESVSMLNVSATQELARRVSALEADNATLRASNAVLQQDVSRLRIEAEETESLKVRMVRFEAALQQIQAGMIQRVDVTGESSDAGLALND
jgi:trimeric autotransporter adhesin